MAELAVNPKPRTPSGRPVAPVLRFEQLTDRSPQIAGTSGGFERSPA